MTGTAAKAMLGGGALVLGGGFMLASDLAEITQNAISRATERDDDFSMAEDAAPSGGPVQQLLVRDQHNIQSEKMSVG